MNRFESLPDHLKTEIFEYDPTYHDYFKRVVMRDLIVTFRMLRDVVMMVYEFVHYPQVLEKYVTLFKKDEIKKLVRFTKTPLPKSYTKLTGMRGIIFHVVSDSRCLGYKVGMFYLEDSLLLP